MGGARGLRVFVTDSALSAGRAKWSCGSTSTAWLQVRGGGRLCAGGVVPSLPWGLQCAVPTPRCSPELCRINEDQKVALDLDPYVKKLLNARRRVVLVNNILQNAQVRVWGSTVC